jgi:hypothetical protein
MFSNAYFMPTSFPCRITLVTWLLCTKMRLNGGGIPRYIDTGRILPALLAEEQQKYEAKRAVQGWFWRDEKCGKNAFSAILPCSFVESRPQKGKGKRKGKRKNWLWHQKIVDTRSIFPYEQFFWHQRDAGTRGPDSKNGKGSMECTPSPRPGNLQRAEWRSGCRQALSAPYDRLLHAWPGNLNDEHFHLRHLHHRHLLRPRAPGRDIDVQTRCFRK